MKRLTTDKPKDNVENTLNLFYIKDKETWIRGGGMAPEYKDETLDNFVRRMIRERMAKWDLEIQVPEDWREFSCMMAEWLFDDPESETGLLALLYAAAWGFAEIRERLKRYEDTGAMPDVLEDLLEGLTRIEKLGGWDIVDRWLKAASEGRLVELPCKVGAIVYGADSEPVMPLHVSDLAVYLESSEGGDFELLENFGTTVFLTEEEAEAALKGEDHGEQV
jgi:hypothetical protein